jgi:hypothetical protein
VDVQCSRSHRCAGKIERPFRYIREDFFLAGKLLASGEGTSDSMFREPG